jgi:hypothetical protein
VLALARGLPSPSQRGKGVLEALMIVYVLWKSFTVLQVRQPVFDGGVGCGRLGRETEREGGRVREREKERTRALLHKKNTTMGQSNVGPQREGERERGERGRERPGGADTVVEDSNWKFIPNTCCWKGEGSP